MSTEELIEVKTKPYGKIQVNPKQRIEFDEGLYGFENEKIFFLLDMEEEDGPFYYLQSGTSEELVFILINPYTFKKDFVLDIARGELKKLGISNTKEDFEDKILIFAIVTIPEDGSDITANLLGPVVINVQEQKGIQALSLVEGYATKHSILKELDKMRNDEGVA